MRRQPRILACLSIPIARTSVLTARRLHRSVGAACQSQPSPHPGSCAEGCEEDTRDGAPQVLRGSHRRCEAHTNAGFDLVLDLGEAGGPESVGQGRGVDDGHGVAYVEQTEPQTGLTVDGAEDAAGSQYPPCLGEQCVLLGGAGHVVKHRVADDRGEAAVAERRGPTIALDDLDTVSELGAQRPHRRFVDLEHGEPVAPGGEDTSGRAEAGSDLEDVAEVQIGELPG